VTITTPEHSLPAARQFPNHVFTVHPDLTYLGTHYNYDVYIDLQLGYLYAVFGNEGHQNYSALGYYLTRTNRPSEPCPTSALAAACALLRHPEYIQRVLESHQ